MEPYNPIVLGLLVSLLIFYITTTILHKKLSKEMSENVSGLAEALVVTNNINLSWLPDALKYHTLSSKNVNTTVDSKKIPELHKKMGQAIRCVTMLNKVADKGVDVAELTEANHVYRAYQNCLEKKTRLKLIELEVSIEVLIEVLKDIDRELG